MGIDHRKWKEKGQVSFDSGKYRIETVGRKRLFCQVSVGSDVLRFNYRQGRNIQVE